MCRISRRLQHTSFIVALVSAMLVGQPVDAAQWQRLGELGLAATRGNSNTETLNGRIEFKLDSGSWQHQFGGDYTRSRGELDEQTELLTQRIELSGSSAYAWGPTTRLLASVRHEEDRFGVYNEQSVLAMNLGMQLLATPTQQLDLSVGPGYRRARLAQASSEEDWVARGALDYSHQLTANTTLTQQSLIEAGSDNVHLQNDLALAVRLNGHLSLSTGLQLRHNSDAREGVATDKLLTTNLSFEF
jgi:putative salt-induced outer membrane protein